MVSTVVVSSQIDVNYRMSKICELERLCEDIGSHDKRIKSAFTLDQAYTLTDKIYTWILGQVKIEKHNTRAIYCANQMDFYLRKSKKEENLGRRLIALNHAISYSKACLYHLDR